MPYTWLEKLPFQHKAVNRIWDWVFTASLRHFRQTSLMDSTRFSAFCTLHTQQPLQLIKLQGHARAPQLTDENDVVLDKGS